MKRRVSPLPALTPRLAQFVLAAFAPFALAAAAWIPPAHAAPFAQLMPRVAPDGQGGSYSAWIGDNGADHLVYAQHYTASGLVAPGWPAAGAVISSPAGVFDDVSIVADGAGGAFIA